MVLDEAVKNLGVMQEVIGQVVTVASDFDLELLHQTEKSIYDGQWELLENMLHDHCLDKEVRKGISFLLGMKKLIEEQTEFVRMLAKESDNDLPYQLVPFIQNGKLDTALMFLCFALKDELPNFKERLRNSRLKDNFKERILSGMENIQNRSFEIHGASAART